MGTKVNKSQIWILYQIEVDFSEFSVLQPGVLLSVLLLTKNIYSAYFGLLDL